MWEGHLFCWECLGEAHEPASCENWKKWYNKIGEVKPEEIRSTEEETENAANCLWLVTNSKSCPNCKSPIQKNEGCNHMKCSKCKFDFCWVCLDQWKRHNSSTGGYFKCNRYEAVKIVNEKVSKAQNEAEEYNAKMQELNKFVHYYTRFKNHENSFKLEEPLLSSTKSKMMKLAEAVTDIVTANAETRFVEDAVHQLLKARRVLKCSYVYGYYLDGPGYKKIVFEFMQTELEECTEILSQMVNRLYLRTPRKRIIEQAQIVQRKRQEFLSAIAKGLVPPETPPGLRKQRRRRYSMDFEDDELRSAVLASIQDVDPANPWIKDASGRHTNVTAMLDWPDSDDSDSEVTTILKLHGTCFRKGCSRTRVKNPRTGDWHDYCSRACMQADQLSEGQEDIQQEVVVDEQMDLLRALEMSRLLYLQEQGILFEQQSRESVLIGEGQSLEEPEGTCEKTIPNKLEDQRSRELGDIVQGVPNRSVEDVGHGDCIDCRTVQKLLADTGIGDLDLGPELTSAERIHGLLESEECLSGPSSVVMNETGPGICIREVDGAVGFDRGLDIHEAGPSIEDITIVDMEGTKDSRCSSKGGAFGIIKELSVSNIDFGGEDKTKNFSRKPKIMNTKINNDDLLSKQNNVCWSNENRGKKKKEKHDLTILELEDAYETNYAVGGISLNLGNLETSQLPCSQNEEDEESHFDLQLSLKQFMKDLTLHGCDESESKRSDDVEGEIMLENFIQRNPTSDQYDSAIVLRKSSTDSVDLDMSVKSGYDSCLESKEPDIISDFEFGSDLHEAEAVVSNFLNAQMLKNYPLEAQFEHIASALSGEHNATLSSASVSQELSNGDSYQTPTSDAYNQFNLIGGSMDILQNQDTVSLEQINIQTNLEMVENDSVDKSTFV